MSFLEDQFGLSGKTALITGGGGTLCSEIAKGYAFAGANIALCGHRFETLEAKVSELIKSGVNANQVTAIEANLNCEEQVSKAVDETINKFGQLDILLNGVGGSNVRCPFVEIDQADFEAVMKLNLLAGCILPTKHVAKYWIDNAIKGVIINIASMGSFNPLSGGWAYSAAKAAVVNQTMAQAKEFAPYGIRANAIAPGFFIGKQNKKLLLNDNGSLTKRGSDVIAHTPMGRFGNPSDLMATAVFLAADGSSFVSGITLPVDGAYLCQNI